MRNRAGSAVFAVVGILFSIQAGAQEVYGSFVGTVTAVYDSGMGIFPVGAPIVGNFSAGLSCFDSGAINPGCVSFNVNYDGQGYVFQAMDAETLSEFSVSVSPSGQTVTVGSIFLPHNYGPSLTFLGADNAFGPDNNLTAATFHPGPVDGGSGRMGLFDAPILFNLNTATLSFKPVPIPDVPTPYVSLAAVPEPKAYTMMLCGLMLLLQVGRLGRFGSSSSRTSSSPT